MLVPPDDRVLQMASNLTAGEQSTRTTPRNSQCLALVMRIYPGHAVESFLPWRRVYWRIAPPPAQQQKHALVIEKSAAGPVCQCLSPCRPHWLPAQVGAAIVSRPSHTATCGTEAKGRRCSCPQVNTTNVASATMSNPTQYRKSSQEHLQFITNCIIGKLPLRTQPLLCLH